MQTETTTTDLNGRIATMRSTIAGMKARRAQSVIDGCDFDHAALARLETELAGLVDAKPIVEAREREGQAQAAADRRREMQQALRDAEQRRLDAVADGDAAASKLLDALAKVDAATVEIVRLHGALDLEVPAAFTTQNQHDRLLKLFCGKAARWFGRRVFGGITFHHLPLHDVEGVTNWSAFECQQGKIL